MFSHAKFQLDISNRFREIAVFLKILAGCGKSHLLKAITQFAVENGMPQMMKRAAPTANAAYLIDGTTLHGLLRIPVPIIRGKPVPELDTADLRSFQADFKNTHLLVIDEKSMLGLEIFHYIDARLRQIKANDENFGGISVILMGDFAQLPPVKDMPLYTKSEALNQENNTLKKENVNKIKATHLYKIFTNVIILDEIMRQQGEAEKEFRDVLTRLVNGKFDEKDWEWLRAQDFDAMDKEKQKQFKDNAVMLCSRNKDLKQHNIYKMKSLGNPIAPVKAVNNNSLAKEAEPSTAGGLHKKIIMAKGAKMVITRNLWKEAGLNNGTTCTVKNIFCTWKAESHLNCLFLY